MIRAVPLKENFKLAGLLGVLLSLLGLRMAHRVGLGAPPPYRPAPGNFPLLPRSGRWTRWWSPASSFSTASPASCSGSG